jgi:hypothetical protein
VQYDKDDRIERQDFLGEFGFQASTENRARKQGLPWPPYVVLGKRIYYSRQACGGGLRNRKPRRLGARMTASDLHEHGGRWATRRRSGSSPHRSRRLVPTKSRPHGGTQCGIVYSPVSR